jgi:PKD repeat protein
MKRLVFFILFCIIANTALYSQNMSKQEVDTYFSAKKEIHFKFTIADKQEIRTLTNIISIDNVKENKEVYAYANKEEFNKFLEYGYAYSVIKNESKETDAYNMASTIAQMSTWDRYPTYTVYEQMMAKFQTDYPTLCNLDTILASTPGGRKILVVKISDNVNSNENEPHFLYTSSMHGDETTGYVLMLRLINYLLSNYGTVSKVTNLVNNAEIWICPLANPDGTYDLSNNTINGTNSSTRYNANGKDLNRNYPDPRIGDPSNSGTSSFYPIQPETQAFMTFATNHYFNMSANFHGGTEVFNYPWDTWTSSENSHIDEPWWIRMGRQYVDTAQLVSSSYMNPGGAIPSADNGVTDGGDWYVITGGRQDYMNFYQKCREVTIELDDNKTTQTNLLPNFWNYNYKSLLNYIQESLYGVRGIITDSCTGLPIKAKVFANSHDNNTDSSFVYSNPIVGNYHRYMINGTYSITYSAPGYVSKTVNNIVLANGSATTVNVQLSKAKPVSGFTNSINGFQVNFTNTSSGATSYHWDFGDGSTSTSTNPSHTYASNGTYYVQLIVMYSCLSDTTTIPITISVTSIDESELNNPAIFPNPSKGTVNIHIPALGNCQGLITIFDLSGKIIYKKTVEFSKGDNTVVIDLHSQSKGLYYVKMDIDGKIIKRKIELTE